MPYWRLSGFYFFYFGALGVLVPFWGLYLKQLGYGPLAIGELMAIPMATKIVAPFIWGWLGDHLGHRMWIVRVGSLLTALTFVGVFFYTQYLPLALTMVLFSFFWNAVLPQFEVVTLRYLGSGAARYAHVRLWGSVGFILAVMLLGRLVDTKGAWIILPVLFGIYVALWLSSLVVTDPDPQPHPLDQSHILEVLRQPQVVAFVLGCFLMQAGHGPYYAFYSILMEQIGFTKTLIGGLWALGVIAEVLVFLVMHRLLGRYGARQVLITSFLLAALRWLLVALFPRQLLLMLLAQLFHAATFGAFHAAAISFVDQHFIGRHQGRGQALYSSLSFGAGGAVGSLVSGMLWEPLGPTNTFLLAAAVSLLAAAIAWAWIESDKA